MHVLLRREGWEINHKQTHRLHREMGLQLRNKTPKRKVKAKLRDDRALGHRLIMAQPNAYGCELD
jgi:putative transposase